MQDVTKRLSAIENAYKKYAALLERVEERIRILEEENKELTYISKVLYERLEKQTRRKHGNNPRRNARAD